MNSKAIHRPQELTRELSATTAAMGISPAFGWLRSKSNNRRGWEFLCHTHIVPREFRFRIFENDLNVAAMATNNKGLTSQQRVNRRNKLGPLAQGYGLKHYLIQDESAYGGCTVSPSGVDISRLGKGSNHRSRIDV